MTPAQTAILAVTAAVFAVWAYLLFRTVTDQRRRATRRTGQVFPDLRAALEEWRHWLTAPDRARDRRQVLTVTLVLLALLGLNLAYPTL